MTCKLICWQLYLFDWLILFSVSALTILNRDRQICFTYLIECLISFYCQGLNYLIFTELQWHHVLVLCFSDTWSFAIIKYISGVTSENWLIEFVFSTFHIVFLVSLSLHITLNITILTVHCGRCRQSVSVSVKCLPLQYSLLFKFHGFTNTIHLRIK